MADVASTDRNKALVRRIVEEMFNRGNLEVAPQIFAADFVNRGQLADKSDGPQGFAQFVKNVRAAFPDLNATIQSIIAEGDLVAMWNTTTATHLGELFGMPPSGKRASMRDFHFFRFANGKIVEHWSSVSLS